MRNRNPNRSRSDADETPWWEESPASSVFDRPAAGDGWTRPGDRTVPASPAYRPTDYPPPAGNPPGGYGPPPAGRATAPPRTAVWPALPYADEAGPGVDRGGRPAAPRRDDGPRSGDTRGRRPRRERSDRDRRGFPLGFGALFGLAGLGCFVVALVVLPWFQVGDRDVGLRDIADSFSLAETDPGDVVPGAGQGSAETGDGLPTPEELAGTVEQEARDAAGEAASEAIDSTRARYLDLYTDTLWMAVVGAAAAAVLLSTLLAPRSFALSLLLGFRTVAGLATMAAAGAHGVALWVVFSGDAAPDPAWGVWLGAGGLAGVLLGCVIGPKR